MKNVTFRQKLKDAGVFIWELAEELGVSEMTMTRKLRHELSEEELEEYLHLIEKIASRKLHEDTLSKICRR